MDDCRPDQKGLEKLDEISDCISALTTSNDNSALESADRLLKKFENPPEELKTKTDRTVINKTSDGTIQQAGDQEAFLREIERDAAERAARRKRNRERAAEWKAKGNEYFKLANYERAADCYTTGIGISKDYELLYQNRANCRIKQARYEEALKDSEAAVFLTNGKVAKAFFHQAKALAGLDRLDEAKEAYRKMGECDDCGVGHADRCIAEIQRLQESREAEARALESFASGTVEHGAELISLLVRVAKGNQPIAYYCGGLRCIEAALNSADSRALFRAKSGFDLLAKLPLVRLAVSDTQLEKLSEEQQTLVCCVMSLCSAACNSDAENCNRVLSLPGVVQRAVESIQLSAPSSSSSSPSSVAQSLSPSSAGLLLTLANCDCAELCRSRSLIKLPAALIRLSHRRGVSAGLAESSAGLLLKLGQCERLRQRLEAAGADSVMLELAASIESLLRVGCDASLSILFTCLIGFRSLCDCRRLRIFLSSRRQFFAACGARLAAMESGVVGLDGQVDAAAETLALALRVTLEAPKAAATVADPSLTVRCVGLSGGRWPKIREHSLALAAELAAGGSEAAAAAAKNADTLTLLGKVLNCQMHPATASGIKLLVACVRANQEFRAAVSDSSAWLDCLLDKLHSSSDSVIGNAALCLSQCLDESGVAERLADTEAIRLLLLRMRECKAKEAKANCAILCGKLAQAHHRHRERLRELDGINILNSTIIHNDIRLA